MLFCQSFTFAEAHEKFALFSENSNFSRKSRSCTESSIFVNVLVIHSSFVLLHECLCLLSNDSSYNDVAHDVDASFGNVKKTLKSVRYLTTSIINCCFTRLPWTRNQKSHMFKSYIVPPVTSTVLSCHTYHI